MCVRVWVWGCEGMSVCVWGCVYEAVCVRVCVWGCVCEGVCMRLCVCEGVCMRLCVWGCVYEAVCVRVCVWGCVCEGVCMRLCVCEGVYVSTYFNFIIFIFTQEQNVLFINKPLYWIDFLKRKGNETVSMETQPRLYPWRLNLNCIRVDTT